MSKYKFRVDFDFESPDDPESRKVAEKIRIRLVESVGRISYNVRELREVIIKLQRINENGPPTKIEIDKEV